MIIICGATASGKSALATEIAKKVNGEIVSCDSMQIYKYMDIGTAKECNLLVPQHLVDVIEPDVKFSVFDYRERAIPIIKDIISRGKTPIIAGGTGLYINSLLYNMEYGGEYVDNPELKASLQAEFEEKGAEYMHARLAQLDEVSAQKIHYNNVKRVLRALYVTILTGKPVSSQKAELTPIAPFKLFVVRKDRKTLAERIEKRVDVMLNEGLEREVTTLIEKGYTFDMQSMEAIGYKEWKEYIEGTSTLEETREKIIVNTRKYAKRQETWFNNQYKDFAIQLEENATLDENCDKILTEYYKNIDNL